MKFLYAIRDNVANEMSHNVYSHTGDPSAIRMFVDALTDQQSVIAKHPKDFDLILIGQFDETTGHVDGGIGPALVLTGSSWFDLQNPAS